MHFIRIFPWHQNSAELQLSTGTILVPYNIQLIKGKIGKVMKSKYRAPNYCEFRGLLKTGAIWICMNIENHYPPADGLWSHLNQTRDEDLNGNVDVADVFSKLKFVYMFEGAQSFQDIISNNYNFQSLWNVKVSESANKEAF